MTQLPDSGYPSDNARTEVQMKQYQEDMRDIFARMPGGGAPEQITELVSNLLTMPTGGQYNGAGTAIVRVEGGPGGGNGDFLDGISTTTHPDGCIIQVRPELATEAITVRHNQNNIQLRLDKDGVQRTAVVLIDPDDVMVLRRVGSSWHELYTFFKSDASLLAQLGIGTAAFKDEGPGNGLDADTLDGKHASAFVEAVGGVSPDSARLGGELPGYYASKGSATQQSFAGEVRSVLVTSRSINPFIQLMSSTDDSIRMDLLWDGLNGAVRHRNAVGTTLAALYMRNNGDMDYYSDTFGFRTIVNNLGQMVADDTVQFNGQDPNYYQKSAVQQGFLEGSITFNMAPGDDGWELFTEQIPAGIVAVNVWNSNVSGGWDPYVGPVVVNQRELWVRWDTRPGFSGIQTVNMRIDYQYYEEA